MIELDHFDLNASIKLTDEEGNLQLFKDKEALKSYFLNDVNQNTVFFHSLEEKIEYLLNEDYYEKEIIDQYSFDFIKKLFKLAYSKKFRFKSFVGAYKYYQSYTLKTFDGKRFLERYEDRVCMNALYLACGDEKLAVSIVEEIISNRYQPATPTFLNAGKKSRGEMISCFLLRIEDSMNSISRSINAALQLSKRGGGVAFALTNIRETGAPIKKVKGQSSGIIPIMKLFEDSFSYANQLGARSGAGAVYINAHHPEIMEFLDTKRENADEKVRIKTLSLGVVIPDITFELAKKNEDMYLFSPYDIQRVYGVPMTDISITEKYYEMVDNPEITKRKISARVFFQTIAELQFESGYPYIMFEDTVNYANPIDGRVIMSNLCVAPDTVVTTSDGDFTIEELYQTTTGAEIWNGEEWSFVEIVKTGTDKQLHKVTVKDVNTGAVSTLTCTDYHKWYDNNGEMLRTNELSSGQKLLEWVAPHGNTVSHEVVSVEEDRVDDTYCFTEPKRNMGVFNGILTGNCSEILQTSEESEYNEDLSYSKVGKDISCNLGSMNVALAMESPNFGKTVDAAIRSLTAVSELSNISSVPSIEKGNNDTHAIGLGQMNLHGFFAKEHMYYGSEESIDFTDMYFYTVAYHAYKASCAIAKERKQWFKGFEKSQYANGEYFKKYTDEVNEPKTKKVKKIFEKYGVEIPTQEDWIKLTKDVKKYGLYNAYLQAVPPTGSISYINNATASIHPIVDKVEVRKEGKLGRVYYPAPHLSTETLPYFETAYDIGYEKIIDVYAAATKHIDQGLSLTLFFKDTATTRDINKAQIYAWKKGIKTLYYIRVKQEALDGVDTEIEECESCKL